VAALRLAQGDPRAAIEALAPVLDGTAAVITPARVGACLLAAIARDEAGDPAGAEAALERALDLAEPDGVVLPFLIHRAPELLERHARRRLAHAALAAKICALLVPGGSEMPGRFGGTREATGVGGDGQSSQDREGAGRDRPPGATLLEPVSEMEMRVLRFLPTNLKASEIAGELYLSVHTVKTHIRHLYTKLGVHGRGEAVQRARALGLLAPSPRRR
jgi:LuxR family maltose regulon positive regulatory protein